MKRSIRVFLLFFGLSFLFVPKLFAQTYIKYKGKKINMIDVGGNKVGVWKMFSGSGVEAVGTIVDNDRMENIEYRYNGQLFARQLNDSVFELEENNQWVKFTLRRVLRTAQDSLNYLEHGEFVVPDFYPQEFVRADGTVLDEEKGNLILKALSFNPMFFSDLRVYVQRNSRNRSSLHGGGAVQVAFEVDTNGNVKNLKIKSSENANLNHESLRLIQSMPRWQPGFAQGHFINAEYTIPLVF